MRSDFQMFKMPSDDSDRDTKSCGASMNYIVTFFFVPW